MTTQQIMKRAATPGYWWVNQSHLGQTPRWEQEPVPYSTEGTIFGYGEKAFLERQYK